MPRILNNGAAINWRREPEAPVDQNSGVLDDTWTDIKVGVGGLAQGGAALGDVVAQIGRDEDDPTYSELLAKADENTVGSEKWMQAKQREYSPARQEQEAEYQRGLDEADGEWGKAGAAVSGMITNPRVALGRLVQSAPAVALTALPGGAAGMVARRAGMAASQIAGRAMGASSATEGIISGAQNAYDTINYNVENNKPRYENLGNSAITALGVGATSLLMNKFGGGVEAALFNKEARDTLRMGAEEAAERAGRGFWHSPRMVQAGKGALAEGAEEAAQAPWETVPQNLATDKAWNEGLGQGMAEGAVIGGALGGAVRFAVGPEQKGDLLDNANKQEMITNEPQVGTPPAPQGQPSPEEIVGDAVAGTQAPQPVPPVPPTPEPVQEDQQPKQPTYQRQFMDTFGPEFLPPGYVNAKSVRQFEAIKLAPFGKDLLDLHVAAHRAAGVPTNSNKIMKEVDEDLQLIGGASPRAAHAELLQRYRGLADQYATGETALAKRDMYAAIVEKLEHPETNLSEFINGQRAQREAEAKAIADAKAAAQAQKEAEKAEKLAAREAKKAEREETKAAKKEQTEAPVDPVAEEQTQGTEAPVTEQTQTGEPVPPAVDVQGAETGEAKTEETTPVEAPKPVDKGQEFRDFSAQFAKKFGDNGLLTRKNLKKFDLDQFNKDAVKKLKNDEIIPDLKKFEKWVQENRDPNFRLEIPTKEEAVSRSITEGTAKVQRERRAVEKGAAKARKRIAEGEQDVIPSEDNSALTAYLLANKKLAREFSAKAGKPKARDKYVLGHALEYLLRKTSRTEREEVLKKAREAAEARKAAREEKSAEKTQDKENKKDTKEEAKKSPAGRTKVKGKRKGVSKEELRRAEVKEILDEGNDLEAQNIDAHAALDQGTPQAVEGGFEDSVNKGYDDYSATQYDGDLEGSPQATIAKQRATKAVGMIERLFDSYDHQYGSLIKDKGAFFDRVAKVEKGVMEDPEFGRLLGFGKKKPTYDDLLVVAAVWDQYLTYITRKFPEEERGAVNDLMSDENIGSPLIMRLREECTKLSNAGVIPGMDSYEEPAAEEGPYASAPASAVSNPSAAKDFVRDKRGGNGGWFRLTTKEAIAKLFANRELPAGAGKFSVFAGYVRARSGEGVGFSLRLAAMQVENPEPFLRLFVSPETAFTTAKAIRVFRKLGFMLPDVTVIDGKRQITPSAYPLESIGLRNVYMGFQTKEDCEYDMPSKLAASGWDTIKATDTYIWLAPHSNPGEGLPADLDTLGTHELTHAWDEMHDYPSLDFVAGLERNFPQQLDVLNDLSLALLESHRNGLTCDEWWRAVFKDSMPQRVKSVLAQLSDEEKAFFRMDFAYPAYQKRRNRDSKYKNFHYAVEVLAVWVSNVYSSAAHEATFKKYFPELYDSLDKFVKDNQFETPKELKDDNWTGRISASYPGRSPKDSGGLHGSQGTAGGTGTGDKATKHRRAAEEVEADRQAKREARVASKLADMKLSAEMAEAANYAPETFDTDRWKKLATDVVEAELEVEVSRGAMNGFKDKSSTNRNYVAAKKLNDANELALSKARIAYQKYLQEHKVEAAPVVMKNVEEYQFPFDRWIRNHTSGKLQQWLLNLNANTFKHTLNFLFTRDLVNLVKDKLPAISEWYNRNLARAELSRKYMDQIVAFGQRSAKFDDATYTRVNQFMERAVLEGLWGYVPKDVLAKMKKEDREKNEAFREELETLPKEAREFFKDALEHGQQMRKDIRAYVLENTRKNFARLIDNASPERAKELKKELELQEKRINEALADSVKPYFPLRRFGDYVVVMRSRAYVEAMQQLTTLRDALRKRDNPTKAEKEAVENAKATLRAMQSNGVDYVVEFAEDRAAALKRRDELRQEFPDGVPETFTRMEFFKDGLPDLSQLERVAQRAASAEKETTLDNVDDKLYVEFSKLANLMWIQALSDDSALKSRLHRRKVTGYSEDMIRSFLETGKVEANYIGYLRHGAEIRQAIDDMKEQTRTSDNRDVATTVLNEVIRRVDDELTGQSKITNAMLRTTSVWMLLTSPAFYLQNLTQPYMLSVPYLSGKFGMYKPLSLMSKNMLRVAKWVKDDPTLSFLDKLEKSNQITAAERKALQTLKEQGLLDMGLSQEFGTILERKGSGWINKMLGYTNMLSSAARRVELVNRVATALTTFELESGRLKAKGLKADAVQINATEYANKVLYETHGDYSSFNSPRAFKAGMLMRLATQFRKFQLIQIGLFYRMVLAGYMNDKNTESAKEKQRWARLGLNWTLGMHLLMTGVKGMPIVGTIAALAGSALGDVGDDDDDYWTKVFGNDEAGKALYRGLPTLLGVDVSEKIGAGTMLSPLPFYDGSMTFKNGEDDVQQLIVQLLGPTASLALKFGRMSPYFQQGDYGKMLEQGAPTGLSNFLKAMRFSSEGITTKAGDVMIPGEKLTLGDIISQGIGLPSNTISGRNRLVASGYRHEEEYKRLKSVLAYQWREAVKSGSAAERKTVVLQLNKINRSRKAQGFKPWTIKELSQTLKAQIRREHSVVNGVATTRSNRGFYERYGSE